MYGMSDELSGQAEEISELKDLLRLVKGLLKRSEPPTPLEKKLLLKAIEDKLDD